MKPSEIFEGENSGLRKTFEEATHNEELERVVSGLFTAETARTTIKHQGIGNCTPENVRAALTSYANSRIQEFVREVEESFVVKFPHPNQDYLDGARKMKETIVALSQKYISKDTE